MIIRPVKKAELPILATIVKQTFWDSFAHMNQAHNMQDYSDQSLTLEKVTEEFDNSESKFFFIGSTTNIQGYLKLNWGDAQTEEVSSKAIEIQRIYVVKSAQGNGLGKSLINFSIDFARNIGAEMIWLGVWDQNESSIAFYKKMGFEVFGDHIFPFGDEKQLDLLMSRSV